MYNIFSKKIRPMNKINGIYAATLSILDENLSLNIDKTINHAEDLIKIGCHGVVFFGSTGQAQLISISEKINLINELSRSNLKKNYIIGTGLNSLSENINLMKISIKLGFNVFLIMPPAYYKYEDEEVIAYYSKIVESVTDAKIILYNFEKLCGYKFSKECVEKLVEKFPKQIIGVKDSSYNLFKELKIENFSVLPGSESKLLDGLKIGCSGIITATCNVTAPLARKVYDDFQNNRNQTVNEKLCKVRETFDKFNLISGIHSFLSQKDKSLNNLLPTLSLLSKNQQKKLFEDLEKLEFNINNLKKI
tara:strand:+ start:49 stop:966 length:918 start_codon:yes stop_codon:yes gene_type:complete